MTKPENPPLLETLPYILHPDDDRLALFSHITLRDLFAGMAMQGLCGGGDQIRAFDLVATQGDLGNWEAACAKQAYTVADAMLKARES